MIIVSGWIRVDAAVRQDYLDGSIEVIRQARAASGCIDFQLSPDALEDDRINVFEQWESVEAVEAFRGSGPSEDQADRITGARVVEYDVVEGRIL